jgi:hypothetical protein
MKLSRTILTVALFSFLFGTHADPAKLKKISYRGGVVEFFIPASWIEEYEKDGGGIFYDPSPDSATLRLNVITAKAPAPLKENSATETLKGLRQAQSGRIESLLNGNALLTYSKPATEAGHKLQMFYWMIANPVKPDHIRIATFSYTLLEGQQEQKRFKDELSLLESEIRKATFSKELGLRIPN